MALIEMEGKITGAVDRLSESVVIIRSTKVTREMLTGNNAKGSGSGFVIDSIGHIVTNYHVVEGSAKVEVILKDGRSFDGAVIGGDKATDVALIKIDAPNLKPAKLGDSEGLKVGQMVLAMGNALDLPGAPTVSLGVISAIGRPMPWADFIFEGLLQTDAAINPGNSGGPLSDLDGNVVGINSAMVAFAQGVGFSIPINTVKWVIEQILEKGRVSRPMLGVSVVSLNPAISKRYNLSINEGAFVAAVSGESPAARAGMREGDVIVGVDSARVNGLKDLLYALSKAPAGRQVKVRFLREGKEREAKIELVEASLN